MLAAGLFGAVVGDLDLVPSMPAHAYLLAYGVTSQSIGYLLIQVSLPRLPAVLTSAILLAQPVMTVILAIILLGEAPSAGQIAGVLLVVLGLALATGTIARVRDDLQGGLGVGRDARLARPPQPGAVTGQVQFVSVTSIV